MAARGGEPVELARLAGSCSTVSWSPDGEHIAFLGIDEAGEPYGCEASLWVVRAAGGDAPRDLAPGRHLHLRLLYGSDLIDFDVDGGSGLTWDGDARGALPAHAGRAHVRSGASRSRASPLR